MYEALFHPAVWMPLVLALVGIAVFVYGNARVQTPVRNAGLGILALTLVWCVAAYLIQTPIEQCVSRTKAIAAACENAKWNDLRGLLDKNTTIGTLNFRGPDQIANVCQQNAEAYGLKSIHILNTDVTQGSPGAYDVTINTLLEGGQSTTARFTFQYEQRSDGILLSRIQPVSVGSFSIEEFQNFVVRHAAGLGR